MLAPCEGTVFRSFGNAEAAVGVSQGGIRAGVRGRQHLIFRALRRSSIKAAQAAPPNILGKPAAPLALIRIALARGRYLFSTVIIRPHLPDCLRECWHILRLN